jgi:fermentation-respiration switch protein FrsA (DUF1100 family)
LGAIAAIALATKARPVARLCLLNAPTAAYIAHRMGTANGSGRLMNDGELPGGYARSLTSTDSACDVASVDIPVQIIHGAADRFVLPSESMVYAHALESAKRHCEHVLVARGDHTFSSDDIRTAALDHVAGFFAGLALSPAAPELVKSGA